VIEKERQIIPVEVKYSSKKIIGKSLFSFIEKFKPKKAIVLTKDFLYEEKKKDCLIQFIPISYV
jgi:Holliday junction resolvase-like predicted endonuclease